MTTCLYDTFHSAKNMGWQNSGDGNLKGWAGGNGNSGANSHGWQSENGESGGVGGAIKDAAKAAVETAAKTALAAGRSHSCYILDLI